MALQLLTAPNWYLEGFVGDQPNLRQIAVNTWPFRIGRRTDASFCLSSNSISKDHAEIRREGQSLVIRDLDSRNGTFVNGHRVLPESRLKSGDIVHFANLEFRLGQQSNSDAGATMQVDRSQWILSASVFDQLFEPGAATPYYQPIVRLRSREICGHEVLARSRVTGLTNPQQMFEAATRLGKEGSLSRLFRQEGVRSAYLLSRETNLFLNIHPAELGDAALVESLGELRSGAPDQALTLEIHEAAITDPVAMRELRRSLVDLEIELAYDDFGAGQARLTDLVEVPPEYLKFDAQLVREIHLGPRQRQQMLGTLVRMAHDLGIVVLAEGVESEGESATCADLGFDLGQGYYYGKPLPPTPLEKPS
ncbi:MAG TPA: EAL domain-containing protein [Pirellulales bacterium]|nr:EAL domain-containing protein [Pirellulales bacterium]